MINKLYVTTKLPDGVVLTGNIKRIYKRFINVSLDDYEAQKAKDLNKINNSINIFQADGYPKISEYNGNTYLYDRYTIEFLN